MSTKKLMDSIDFQFQKIIGLAFRRIRRMAATGSIGIGDMKSKIDKKGESVSVPQYALHIQCAYRIVDRNKVVVSNLDMFGVNSSTEWTENFDWDVDGVNLYDEKTSAINKDISEAEVLIENVKASPYGDVDIFLSNGWIIQIFVNYSSQYEAWGLFEVDSDTPHFVVTGQGVQEP